MAFTEILFFLCATAISGNEGTVELSNYIQNHSHTLCPFTNYCSKKPSDLFKNETIIPCCSDCSCDASTCYQTENCCPDIEPIPDKTTDLICSDTMTKFNQWDIPKVHNGYKYGIKRYFVTTTCPGNYEDEFVVSKCKGDNNTELNDFLWVSHLDNNIIYQNYFCAICHGVENWVTWNFRTNCFQQLIETGYQNLTTTLLSDECEIVNEVPEMKVDVSRRYQCYMPDFTSCNTTGKWTQYDPILEEACHSFTQPYYKIGNGFEGVLIYENVFCWLCNANPESGVPTLCQDLAEHPSRTESGKFSALIDYNRLEEIENKESLVASGQCSRQEIYDKYMNRCRTLECPGGSLPVDGACKQVVSHISRQNGLKILFMVNIKNNWSEITDTKLESEMGQKMSEELDFRLGLHTCGNCEVVVWNSSEIRHAIEILVSFVKLTTPSCQLDVIYKRVLAVSGQQIEIELTSGMRLTAIAKIAEKLDYNMLLRGKYIFNTQYQVCSRGTRIEIIEPLCPRINLELLESLKLKNGTKKQAFLNFFQNVKNQKVNETSNVPVCIEDYNKAMRKNSGSASRKLLEATAIFIYYNILFSLL